ncbi:hypothetical protein ACHQM5_008975 [Ranunculus cassubicifolius]
METSVKHMRVSFSGVGDSDERRLPPQKTQSFKGGKRGQNWFRRQFSGDMNRENSNDTNSSEFATALAAAAAAIHSIEESHRPRRPREEHEAYSPKGISIRDDNIAGRVSKRYSGKDAIAVTSEASMKKPEVPEQRTANVWTDNQKTPKKASSMKKTPTFTNNNMNGNVGKKIGTMLETKPPSYEKFPTERPVTSGIGATKADAWEKAEMEKINKRYERMNSTILSWENEKKGKAKRRMDRIESEIERRRARATQRYRSDITKIDQVAGGARAVAEDKRRDDVTKTKEKANRIRRTGKVPCSCFCF